MFLLTSEIFLRMLLILILAMVNIFIIFKCLCIAKQRCERGPATDKDFPNHGSPQPYFPSVLLTIIGWFVVCTTPVVVFSILNSKKLDIYLGLLFPADNDLAVYIFFYTLSLCFLNYLCCLCNAGLAGAGLGEVGTRLAGPSLLTARIGAHLAEAGLGGDVVVVVEASHAPQDAVTYPLPTFMTFLGL